MRAPHRSCAPVGALPPLAPPLDQRLIEWPAALESRRCPLCDADRPVPVVTRPDRLVVVRCDSCGMIYLPVVPSEQQLAEFYAKYSTQHQAWHSGKTAEWAMASARRRRDGNGLLREIEQRRTIDNRTILEIGCSRGSFLLDAREIGARVSGVEIDGDSRDFVSALGIPCHASLELAHRAGPYDIIVALNVIEHLPAPKRWLDEVTDMLEPGGLLVIWTPNGGQVSIFGAGWVGFRVDLDHLNYFSSSTLSRLLLDAGLWPEALWEFSQANLSGFRSVRRTAAVADRIRRWWRAPVQTWALPRGGGGYTLALLAGKALAGPK